MTAAYPVPSGTGSTVRRWLVQTSLARSWSSRTASRLRPRASTTWRRRAGRRASSARAAEGTAIEVQGAPAPRRRRDVRGQVPRRRARARAPSGSHFARRLNGGELERVRYGLTKNIHTFKPTRVAFHEFADIARDVRGASSWRHRIGYLFRSPGWSPDGSGGAPAAERAQQVSTLLGPATALWGGQTRSWPRRRSSPAGGRRASAKKLRCLCSPLRLVTEMARLASTTNAWSLNSAITPGSRRSHLDVGFESDQAAALYSWISPPSRSRLFTVEAEGVPGKGVTWARSGAARPKARCGRCPL